MRLSEKIEKVNADIAEDDLQDLFEGAEDLETMIEDQQSEIKALTLALKESTLLAQETTILFTASVKREKDLMGAIARHKWNKYKDDECIEDVLLWELLGEVEP